MPDVPINYDNLASIAATHDPTAPIYVLNLWKYRTTASYAPEHAHLAGRPCTGYEAGVRYRTALRPLVPPNTSAFLVAKVLTGVAVPEDEDWDDVFILRYETLEGFKKMLEYKEYKEDVEPHRLAGLKEWRLIMLENFEV